MHESMGRGIPERCSYGCIDFLYKYYLYELDDKCHDSIDELGSGNFKRIKENLNLIKSYLEGITCYHNLMRYEQNNPEIPEEIIEKEFLRLPMGFIGYRTRYMDDNGNVSHYYIVNHGKVRERIGEHVKCIDVHYRNSMTLINCVKFKKQTDGG